jgi:hypothetical protein
LAVSDCQKIVKALSVSLGDAEGNGEPIFTDEEIIFNGAGRTGCERFQVLRCDTPRRGTQVSSYCKTEKLPYDICVQVSLIVLKHHLKNAIAIASDGKDDDWKKAREVCHAELGYGDEFRIDRL